MQMLVAERMAPMVEVLVTGPGLLVRRAPIVGTAAMGRALLEVMTEMVVEMLLAKAKLFQLARKRLLRLVGWMK